MTNVQDLPQPYEPSNETIYKEVQPTSGKSLTIGLVVGSVVGAIAGLLLAPKPGSELRSVAATQAARLKEKGVSVSSVAKDKTVQLSSQIKEKSSIIVDKVKSKTQKAVPTDDGTVSSEGEETLEEFLAEVDAIAEQELDGEAIVEEVIEEDISALSRHSSI